MTNDLKTVALLAALAMALAALPASAKTAGADRDLIVGFSAGISPTEQRQLIRQAGGRPGERIGLIDSYVVDGGSDTAKVASKLNASGDVKFVEPDGEFKFDRTPNDPIWTTSTSSMLHWSLLNTDYGSPDADIDITEAWDIKTSSKSVLVADINTGVDAGHGDLSANLWRNTGEYGGQPGVDDDGDGLVDDINGWDFGDNDGDISDQSTTNPGHGTTVAGVIGAVGHNGFGIAGVNWKANIMALKFSKNGGSEALISDALDALDFAIKQGAFVVNMSFGTTGAACSSEALLSAFDAAESAGVLVVASSGNDGIDTDSSPERHCPSALANSNIIAVASSDSTDSLPTQSNFGAQSVDLAAPGAQIYTTYPGGGFAQKSGTSYAAPHATGVAVLLKALNPNASVKQVRDAILTSVDSKPQLAGKVATGGRLNAFAAMKKIDTKGPKAKLKIVGRCCRRGQKVTVIFAEVEERAGIASMSFSVAGGPFGKALPYAKTHKVKLLRRKGRQRVRARLIDKLGNTRSIKRTLYIKR